MKYFSSLVLALFAAVIVLFSINNLHTALLDPWPLGEPTDTPVYLIVLLPALIGFLVGALVAWAAGIPARRRAARQRRDSAKLQAELDRLRSASAKVPGTDIQPTAANLDTADRMKAASAI